MAEVFEITDLRILDRFAQKQGYSGLAEYLPTLHTWDIPVPIAAELVRRDISFSAYRCDPSLLEEERVPEGVVDIFEAYRARDERIAQARMQNLEERIPSPACIPPTPVRIKHPLRSVFYGIGAGVVAAFALMTLSTLQPDSRYLESELLHDPLCTSIEGLYVCLDHSEQGAFFGSYLEYQKQKEEF